MTDDRQLHNEHGLSAELLAILTHDINNLLMVIKGYLDLTLLEKDDLSGAVKENLMIAARATENLAHLIMDLTDIGRMEDGRLPLNLEDADVSELVSGIVEKIKPLALEAGVDLTMEGASAVIPCNVDKELISRALTNLITNGVKSIPSGGRVKVSIDPDENNLKIAVNDTGFWIPPEYREKIFEKDAQGEIKKANLRRGGGFSLTFCKMAVQAHGGRIRVESEGEDKGSVFIFSIPRRRAGKGSI